MKKQSDTVYALYLNEVKTYRLLTAEEEKALLERIAEGDEAARKRFINSNLRLVISIAGRLAGEAVGLGHHVQQRGAVLIGHGAGARRLADVPG